MNNTDVRRTITGFTSADFPGVSPRTRFGSYVWTPGYSYPDPRWADPRGYGGFIDTFRPLTLGLLRLPQLKIKGPNQFFPSVIANMQTPAIRKLQTGEISY